MCVLYGMKFAHIVHRSYIIVGRLVIPNLGHFGSPGSLTNWYHSGKMPLNHEAICYKGLPHDLMMKSIALIHIYCTYIASGSTFVTSHDCQSQISHFCGACWERVHKSVYAPDWEAKWGDHPHMVPSNSV